MRRLAGASMIVLLVGCQLLPASGPRPSAMDTQTSSPVAAPVTASPEAVPGSPEPVPTSTSSAAASSTIPRCDDLAALPLPQAPAEWYRDEPFYINGPPTDEVIEWALTKPGFELPTWLDREHNGWLALPFSRDAEARQAELRELFPDLGAVVVPVDWTRSELDALTKRARTELGEIVSGTGIGIPVGYASLYIGVLSPDRIAAVEERFSGERVCVEGADPANVPSPGPQPQSGEGWRLLADGDGVGPAYRTAVGFDEDSYAELWDIAEVVAERPPVDFDSEIVIWFGVVTGSICPPIRMDDVIVDLGTASIYPEVVHLGFGGCTDDIHPHAYIVAIERSRLPPPPFRLQLWAANNARDAITVVDADLRQPGSIAGPGEVHGEDSRPEPRYVEPGDDIEPGFPADYQQTTHCGLEWLGPLNDVNFRTSEADGADWIPAEWQVKIDQRERIVLEVVMHETPPTLEATANGRTVIYDATAEDPPGCD